MRFRIVLALVAMLVFGMTGVAAAQDPGTGGLYFIHDIEGGPEVVVAIVSVTDPTNVETLGPLAYDEEDGVELPAGDYTVGFAAAADPTTPLGVGTATVVADEDTDVYASDLLTVAPSPSPSPSPSASATASASPSASPIRTPSRVETGAGGAADEGVPAMALLAGVALLATAGVVSVARRRSA